MEPTNNLHNQEEFEPTTEQMKANDFGTTIKNATIHFLLSIVYFIFGMPFALWNKAINRLAVQKNNGTLQIGTIKSFWPFLSFLKAFLLEFLFDALTFIVYPAGALCALYEFFRTLSIRYRTFQDALETFLIILIVAYYLPIAFSLVRDFVQLFIVLPLRKLVSWLTKPAQFMNFDIKETSK